MTIVHRRSYLNQIRLRYQNGTKKEKGKILDEFCAVCSYTRKYAIRICRGKIQPRLKKPGRQAKYTGGRFLFYLTELWELMGRLNSKSMKVAIPVWLPFCKDIPAEFKLMLVEVSPATIDRLLKPQRGAKPKARSSTRPSLIKNKIPLKLLDREVRISSN
ncbi:MAG: hypothetical protein IPL83_09320 [Bdellovibrionales bacterium]|nr:hypothetical protein [Bdellovibrionales bacterium]